MSSARATEAPNAEALYGLLTNAADRHAQARHALDEAVGRWQFVVNLSSGLIMVLIAAE